MLRVHYYTVDVGENYCAIRKRKWSISVKNVFWEKSELQSIVALNHIRHALRYLLLNKSKEYKLVAVNKIGKLWIDIQVENLETNEKINPIYVTRSYNVYVLHPEDELFVRCKIHPNETENRVVSYEAIEETMA